jgi:hypothetical protein
LTLFKPWRHGKNLKEDDHSWDEAFTSYKCNDARDDYSKLLKQRNATDGIFPHWFRADDNENFDGDDFDDEEYEADLYTSVGKKRSTKVRANSRNTEDL